MPRAVIFDDGLGLLSPLTDLRPAMAVRTGALTTLQRLRAALDLEIVGLRVPERIAPLTREMFDIPVNAPVGAGDVLAVSGRCPVPPAGVDGLGVGEGIVEAGSGDLVAAKIGGEDADALMGGTIPSPRRAREVDAPALISRPWHVRTFRDRALRTDLALAPAEHETTAPASVTAMGASRLSVHPLARLYPGCILDLEGGPIWIDESATIRPGATVIGPAYIGAHSTVLDHALIKANTAIGPWCKIAGEVGGTIFQGYANKAHDGHLGDSWVGEWANFGAGTTNSNLLNTYGQVKAQAAPGADAEPTGEQFLGCIVGDHAKFAICTRIMTGAVVGTGVMWAASAPLTGHVRSFAWVTDGGESAYRFDKFVEVARAVMGRRSVKLSNMYSRVLREVGNLA